MPKRVKYLKLDADFIRSLEGGECRFLSEKTQTIALALLEYQRWETRWDGTFTGDEINSWVDQAAYELITENPDCLAQCWSFGPTDGRITWEPQNPFTEPFFTPDGYLSPPFTVVKPTDVGLLAIGLLVGDVITDITRFPDGSLPTVVPPDGFARFRVSFTGTEIEIEFVQIPLGGIVLITRDDDPLTAQTYDLDKDLISLPPEVTTANRIQIDGLTNGPHHVDVTFLPWVNEEAPFLKYGGGLRSITVCGVYEGMFDVRQDPENPCKLQKFVGDVWVDYANLKLCPTSLRRNPATGEIEYSVDDIDWFRVADGPWTEDIPDPIYPPPNAWEGLTEANARCRASANAANVLHTLFNETADYINLGSNTELNIAAGIITIIGVILLSAVTAAFLVPIIGVMIALGIVFNRAHWDATVTETLINILYCNSTVTDDVVSFDFDTILSQVIGQGVDPFIAIEHLLYIITEDGLNAAGGTKAIDSADCGDAPCESVEYCLNFSGGSGQPVYAFAAGSVDSTFGNPQPSAKANAVGGFNSGHTLTVDVVVPEGAQVISSVEFDLYWTSNGAGNPNFILSRNAYLIDSSNNVYYGSPQNGAPTTARGQWLHFVYTFASPIPATKIRVNQGVTAQGGVSMGWIDNICINPA